MESIIDISFVTVEFMKCKNKGALSSKIYCVEHCCTIHHHTPLKKHNPKAFRETILSTK